MPTLKPIKVTLSHRTHADGQASVYPDFRALFDVDPTAFNNRERPSDFFKRDCISWHTNKISNLGTGATNGEAITAGPPANIDLILAAGIEGVSAMVDEAEVEEFFDEKAHAHQPSNLEDEQTLAIMAAKRQIGLKETASDRAALDPDDPRIGIRRNPDKTWARFKEARNITLTFV